MAKPDGIGGRPAAGGAPQRRPTDTELLRIGEVAERVGMTPDLVRAWERRYGVPRPVRTPGGQRRYDRHQTRRLIRMRSLVDEGLPPAEAARRTDRGADTTDVEALVAVQRCLRSFLRSRRAADVVAAMLVLTEELGGVPEEPVDGRAEQIPVDLTLGTGPPLLAATPPLSLARMRLERILPEIVVDARRMVDLIEGRDGAAP